jgi:RNase P/RNase MRP subunit p29
MGAFPTGNAGSSRLDVDSSCLPLEKDAMQIRRKFLLTLSACLLGMGVVVASVLADELLGVITKVDYETKKVTVIEKDKDDEIVLETNADTEYVTKDGTIKVDKEVYEKLEKGIEKAKDAGKKGIMAKIWHEKKVISKIQKTGKGKKAAN